ncbi:MAG: hypothetical protein LBC99_02035 [Spirochaetota bacterium]|jgi:hypothetical protein|nr:hypothetical protein [Spirochaetota bacterium]
MVCASCGKEVRQKGRIQFRERCPFCDAPLHTCVHCGFYEKGAYNQCREPKAERQVEKERENRCEYFSASSKAPSAAQVSPQPKAAFDALFSKENGKDT